MTDALTGLCHTRSTMHKILVRAIITGFGMRLGGELAKFVVRKAFPKKNNADGDDEADEGDEGEESPPGAVTPDPPEM